MRQLRLCTQKNCLPLFPKINSREKSYLLLAFSIINERERYEAVFNTKAVTLVFRMIGLENKRGVLISGGILLLKIQ